MSQADSANHDAPSPRRWPGSISIALLALLGLALLIYYPVRATREAARRSTCKDNLRQICLALHAYHEEHGSFPPAYTVNAVGRRIHSWRVLILPHLGEDELYSQYRFDEPWDGPHNRELAVRMPAVFGCPSNSNSLPGRTLYLAVVGPQTIWPEQYAAGIRHCLDGSSNTIQLVEWDESDVLWHEPRDLPFTDAIQSPLRSTHPPDAESGGFHISLCDGAVRTLSTQVDRELYRKLLTARSGLPFPGVDWPVDLPAGGYDFGQPVASTELPSTDVVPYTAGPIAGGRNYIHCATFPLAWDDFRSVVGGDPIRLEGDPPFVDSMNAESFPRSALAQDCFVARGGLMRDGILDQILADMTRKFPDAQPQLLATRPSEMAVVMYAYLRKVLPFREKFDRLEEPLNFEIAASTQPVAAFGLPATHPNLIVREQVTVLDYTSDDDFILRIDAGNRQDGILLGKVQPGATLSETIAAVQQRIAQPDRTHSRRALEHGEPLAVPVLTLNVRRDYDEIIDLDILNPELRDLFVHRAAEIIRFRLDETGAHLIAEAEIIGENGHDEPPPPPRPRRFLLDRPFLLLLQERDAPALYFAAWIANTELMERGNNPVAAGQPAP